MFLLFCLLNIEIEVNKAMVVVVCGAGDNFEYFKVQVSGLISFVTWFDNLDNISCSLAASYSIKLT